MTSFEKLGISITFLLEGSGPFSHGLCFPLLEKKEIERGEKDTAEMLPLS
jgi:hypothetical protein